MAVERCQASSHCSERGGPIVAHGSSQGQVGLTCLCESKSRCSFTSSAPLPATSPAAIIT